MLQPTSMGQPDQVSEFESEAVHESELILVRKARSLIGGAAGAVEALSGTTMVLFETKLRIDIDIAIDDVVGEKPVDLRVVR